MTDPYREPPPPCPGCDELRQKLDAANAHKGMYFDASERLKAKLAHRSSLRVHTAIALAVVTTSLAVFLVKVAELRAVTVTTSLAFGAGLIALLVIGLRSS